MLFPQPNRDLDRLLEERAAQARVAHFPDRAEQGTWSLSCGCKEVYVFAESRVTLQGWCSVHRVYFTFLGMANC